MPDIDRNADIKVHCGTGLVAAEIPLAGHASQHWLALFHDLASKSREVPGARKDPHPEVALDAVSALIIEVNDVEQQSGTAQTEAAIRDWWARQQR